MRSNIKDQSYFNKYIKFQETSISEFLEDYNLNKDKWDNETIRSLFSDLARYSLHSTFAKFSAGENIISVKESFLSTIEYSEASWGIEENFKYGKNPVPYFSLDQYWKMLSLLSLGFLLKIEQADFERIIKMRDVIKEKDQLLDFIVNSRIVREIDTHVMDTNKYEGLIKVINSPTKEIAQVELRSFLEKKWYVLNKKVYWHDDHKSEFDIYFGHWCFAAGTLAKLLDLDDTSFKNNEYYPYDLVHWDS